MLLSITLLSCTKNQRAKSFGGTETVDLPLNCVFINSTWKDEQLWIVVYDTLAKQNYMYEESSYGLIEGKIIFNNHEF